MKFDVSNTSYYVEVENGALSHDIVHITFLYSILLLITYIHYYSLLLL